MADNNTIVLTQNDRKIDISFIEYDRLDGLSALEILEVLKNDVEKEASKADLKAEIQSRKELWIPVLQEFYDREYRPIADSTLCARNVYQNTENCRSAFPDFDNIHPNADLDRLQSNWVKQANGEEIED